MINLICALIIHKESRFTINVVTNPKLCKRLILIDPVLFGLLPT